MRRVHLALWFLAAACGGAPAPAHADHLSGPEKKTLPDPPVELTGVTSQVAATHLDDLAGTFKTLLTTAMSNADWHGVTRAQHLRVTAAVQTLKSSRDGEGAHSECVVEAALLDPSGKLLALVHGRGRVDGGALVPAERDALEAAAERAAKALPEAARRSSQK